MYINRSILHRAIVALMTSLLFLATGIYSCVSAGSSLSPLRSGSLSDQPASDIRFHAFASLLAQDVAMQAELNSQDIDIKPILCPKTDGLDLSRYLHPDNTSRTSDLKDRDYDVAAGRCPAEIIINKKKPTI